MFFSEQPFFGNIQGDLPSCTIESDSIVNRSSLRMFYHGQDRIWEDLLTFPIEPTDLQRHPEDNQNSASRRDFPS